MQKNQNEKPEVYAIRQGGGSWQISRRDFLKAAGIGAAASGIGLNRASAQDSSFYEACRNTAAHKSTIYDMALSSDGKYLISRASGNIRCWDFETKALLGKASARTDDLIAGYFSGRSCVFLPAISGTDYVQVYEIPLGETNNTVRIFLPSPHRSLHSVIFDSSENMYAESEGCIVLYSRESDFHEKEIIYENSEGRPISRIKLFDQEKKLFVRFGKDDNFSSSAFGILDMGSRTMTVFDDECREFEILHGRNQALISTETEYRLISLEDGSVLWTQVFPDAENAADYKEISDVAVVPDGTKGLLMVESADQYMLCLISMADGSLQKTVFLAVVNTIEITSDIVVNAAGTECAVSLGQNILFFSLPDLKLEGCPFDVWEMKTNQKGMELTVTDPGTGEEIKYTLPAGAAIPDGAVCTCNLVSGKNCPCVSHNGHYWHPN